MNAMESEVASAGTGPAVENDDDAQPEVRDALAPEPATGESYAEVIASDRKSSDSTTILRKMFTVVGGSALA